VSSANLDLVRSIYAAFERGDWFGSAEWAHPEIEFVIVDGPDPGRWTGIAAMAEAWRDVMSVLEDGRIEVNEYRELDDERVLVLVIFQGRGKTSVLEVGSQMATKAANLLHIRNG
jgi:ketosteroid isomerase-like protein